VNTELRTRQMDVLGETLRDLRRGCRMLELQETMRAAQADAGDDGAAVIGRAR